MLWKFYGVFIIIKHFNKHRNEANRETEKVMHAESFAQLTEFIYFRERCCFIFKVMCYTAFAKYCK